VAGFKRIMKPLLAVIRISLFDLGNNRKNLEEIEKDNPFDYFLQSDAWAVRSIYHITRQVTASPCRIVFVKISFTVLPLEQSKTLFKNENKTF
jgi:hypothetical protein